LKLVFITCPEEAAHDITSVVLREHFAAGATVLSGAASTFWWKSGLENATEAVIILRTEEHMLKELLDQIRVLHPYEVPEILVLDAVSLNPAYTQWIKDELPQHQAAHPKNADTATQTAQTRTVKMETVTDLLKTASAHPLKIIVLGAPGAGARSVAYRIARRLMWPTFSPVEKLVSENGFSGNADKGDLLPDDRIQPVATSGLQKVKNGGVVVGFPRNQAQVKMLAAVWEHPDIVFILNLNRDEAIKRLRMRLSCACGRTYGPALPPSRAGICNACGARLFHRPDDVSEEAITKRYSVWNDVTRPLLLATYVAQVHPIEASMNYDAIIKEISQALTKKLIGSPSNTEK